MTSARRSESIDPLDRAVSALVRFSARIAAGSEQSMRAGCSECVTTDVPVEWVEELLLQSYLFCGFPRALNATREWRRISGVRAPAVGSDRATPGETDGGLERWRAQGEATCAIVYGEFYGKLRQNIVALHPALDEWMIAEGYGKILSRPGLELRHRELCIVAACIAGGQERQLHSHLHGALNAGSSPSELRAALNALHDLVTPDQLIRSLLLLDRVTPPTRR